MMKTTSMKISDSLYFDGSYRTKDTVTAEKYLETSALTSSLNYVRRRGLSVHDTNSHIMHWKFTLFDDNFLYNENGW